MRTIKLITKTCAALLLVLMTGACTTTTITPELVQKPTSAVDRIAVGDIAIDPQYQQWGYLIAHFRQGLLTGLREGGFSQVIESPSNPGGGAMLLNGRITEVDEGSMAARIIIGFGAGRARTRGVFELKDERDIVQVRFESRKAYSGGAGIGGMDMVSLPTMMTELGQETAKSIIRWSKGQDLEPPD